MVQSLQHIKCPSGVDSVCFEVINLPLCKNANTNVCGQQKRCNVETESYEQMIPAKTWGSQAMVQRSRGKKQPEQSPKVWLPLFARILVRTCLNSSSQQVPFWITHLQYEDGKYHICAFRKAKTSIWEYVVLVWLKTPLLSIPLASCCFHKAAYCLPCWRLLQMVWIRRLRPTTWEHMQIH